jgi:hypothetical protein
MKRLIATVAVTVFLAVAALFLANGAAYSRGHSAPPLPPHLGPQATTTTPPTPAPTCAPSWALAAVPEVGSMGSLLKSVDAVSRDDMWAVGHYLVEGISQRRRAPMERVLPETGQKSAPEQETPIMHALTLRWNGFGWEQVAAPNAGTDDNTLFSVEVISATDAWAVGYYVNDFGVGQTLTLHWDGTTWSIVPSPNAGDLLDNLLDSVEAVSSTDVWAAGYYYNDDGIAETLTLHWDGTAWSVIPSPNTADDDYNYLYDLAVVSSTDVWAVGAYVRNLPYSASYRSLVLHWDGASWTRVSSPSIGSSSNVLFSVDALAADDLWAVGSFYSSAGGQRTLTQHWDGTQWTLFPSPTEGYYYTTLYSVKMVSSDDVWAVGTTSTSAGGPQTLTVHWDGTSWKLVRSPNLSGFYSYNNVLNSVEVLGPDEAWAVGQAGYYSEPEPLAEHYSTACVSCGLRFSDVPEGSTFFNAILCLTCQGIAGGYSSPPSPVSTAFPFPTGSPTPPPDPVFRPNANVTRGQLAKIISNSANYDEDIRDPLFADVAPYSTYFVWVNRLARHGVMTGYPCGTTPNEPCYAPQNLPYFRPGADATRGQIAKVVSNASEYNEPHTEQTFADVPTDHPFYIWIARLSSRYLIGGYPCGTTPSEPCDTQNRPYFRWGNNATRGQVAKIVSKNFFPNCYVP